MAACVSAGWLARASGRSKRPETSQRTFTGKLSLPSVSGTSRRPSKNCASFRSRASFQIDTPPTRFGSHVGFAWALASLT